MVLKPPGGTHQRFDSAPLFPDDAATSEAKRLTRRSVTAACARGDTRVLLKKHVQSRRSRQPAHALQTDFLMLPVRLFFVLALAIIALSPQPAHATVPIAIDIDYALPVDAGPVSDGFGGQLRFGPALDLAILKLTAEAGLGVHDFSGPAGPTVYRGFIGTRFGLGFLLRPSIYGHAGVGHADWSTQDDLTHLTLDVGAALDLTLARSFELGAHAGYGLIFGNGSAPSFGFMMIGGHVAFVLDPEEE